MAGEYETAIKYDGNPILLPPFIPQETPYISSKICGYFYGSMVQYAVEANYRPHTDTLGIKQVQIIISDLLYYKKDIENKLLVDISAIGPHKDSATKNTLADTSQLLDYAAMNQNSNITYRAFSRVLTGHSDAYFLNKSNARSQSGTRIFIFGDIPIQSNNGPLLYLTQIINIFMSLAAESELTSISITEKNMVSLCQTIIVMGWPKTRSDPQM